MKPEPLNLEFIDKWFEKICLRKGSTKKWIEQDVGTIMSKHKEIKELKDEVKQRIKSACEFWLRYKDRPDLLYFDFPIWEIRVRCKEFEKSKNLKDYNEWLFKLAFKDVINIPLCEDIIAWDIVKKWKPRKVKERTNWSRKRKSFWEKLLGD
ncbi:MAG: hypothetical protein ACTSUF_09765 [Candidatus Heimdallarchaeaceae archaeon]